MRRRLSRKRVLILTPLVLFLAFVTWSLASGQPIGIEPDLAQFVTVRIVDDSAQAVRATGCWDTACRDMKNTVTDTIRPGGHREVAYWGNDRAGASAVRFERAGAPPGCVVVRWHRGQRRAIVRASEAKRCGRSIRTERSRQPPRATPARPSARSSR